MPSLDLKVFKQAEESSKEGIITTDATQKDCPIVYINPAFSILTGYTVGDILGKNSRILCAW